MPDPPDDAPGRQSGATDVFEPISNAGQLRFTRFYPMSDKFPDIAKAVFRSALEKPDAQIFATKTPTFYDNVDLDRLFTFLGIPKFVFTIRNPIDAINSSANRRNNARLGNDEWPDDPVGEMIAKYRRQILQIFSYKVAFGERCLIMKYEDLTHNSVIELDRLSQFIGTDVTQTGITIHDDPRKCILTDSELNEIQLAFPVLIRNWSKIITRDGDAGLGYIAEAVGMLENSQQISFTTPASRQEFLGVGWSFAEAFGTWSLGYISVILFQVREAGPAILRLRLTAMIADVTKGFTLTCNLNNQYENTFWIGSPSGRIDTTNGQTIIAIDSRNAIVELNLGPANLEVKEGLFLRVDCHSPARPRDALDIPDNRLLGIKLIACELVPAPQSDSSPVCCE
jgi:Sulfotransferase family